MANSPKLTRRCSRRWPRLGRATRPSCRRSTSTRAMAVLEAMHAPPLATPCPSKPHERRPRARPILARTPLGSVRSHPHPCVLHVAGSVQPGSFAIPAAAAAASAASRTGQKCKSHIAGRSTEQGVLPAGAVSICIATDGSDGCRNDEGNPVEQSKIWWEQDATGKVHFVVCTHGCGRCFRPCMREGSGWRILKKSEVPQTSTPTANRWIAARAQVEA